MVRIYWKALAWNIVILILSLLPADELPDKKWTELPHFDKIIHFLMYALLTMLILQKNHILFGKFKQINVLAVSLGYVFLMGFFIEILQNSFLIGRNFDIFDVVANATGSLFAIIGYKIYNHLKQ